MAGTYNQMYIQVVFGVKRRQNLLLKPWREDVFKYMSGIIKAKGHVPIIVNGVEDHVHVFFGLNPRYAVSDLVRDLKNNTSNFINKNNLTPVKFSWQGGCGVFSYSKSATDNVYNYILNQEEHHRKQSFLDEYVEVLREYEVEFDESYLFHAPE